MIEVPLVPLLDKVLFPVRISDRSVLCDVPPTKVSVLPPKVMSAPWPRLLAAPPTLETVLNRSVPSLTNRLPEKVFTPVRRTALLVPPQAPCSSLMFKP